MELQPLVGLPSLRMGSHTPATQQHAFVALRDLGEGLVELLWIGQKESRYELLLGRQRGLVLGQAVELGDDLARPPLLP